jgi:hypothetical protein
MKMKIETNQSRRRTGAAFTLVEVMMASGTFAVACLAGFMGVLQGFQIVQSTRENLRATEILQDNAEILRLYTWQQLNTPGFVPLSFTNSFNPAGAARGNAGVTYYGKVTIAAAPLTESYASNMKMLTFQLNWTNNVAHQRQLTTLVSLYGIHNYLY